MRGFRHYARVPYNTTQRTAPRFQFAKNVAKKSVTQEIAAASGVPPAFGKQLWPCCIFRKCPRRAGGIAARCSALRYVTDSLRTDGNHT